MTPKAKIDAARQRLAKAETQTVQKAAVEEVVGIIDTMGAVAVHENRDVRVALAKFLDTLAGPDRNALLLETCDRLYALDVKDPIIAASAAQALVDLRGTRIGGPSAALTVLKEWVDPEYPDRAHLAVACMMRARAHKDLYYETLMAGRRTEMAFHAQAAFAAYKTAFQMTENGLSPEDRETRAWLWRAPAVNLLSMAAVMKHHNIPFSDPAVDNTETWLKEHSEDIKARIDKRLRNRTREDQIDAWDHASLAEIEIANGGDASAAQEHLKNYLNDLRQEKGDAQPDFKFAGTVRQFSEILGYRNDGFEVLRAAMRATSFELQRIVVLTPDMVQETLELSPEEIEESRTLQSNWTGDRLHSINRLISLVNAAQNIAEISNDNGRLGTGFAVKLGELLGELRPEIAENIDPNEVVLVTCAHVSTWPGQYKDSEPPERLAARFHYADGKPTFELEEGWTHNPEAPKDTWLDYSVLRLKGTGTYPPGLTTSILHETPAANIGEEAFVIGFPQNASVMSVALEHNKILEPLNEATKAREVLYESATDHGSSGAPVLRSGASGLKVFAVHYSALGWRRANAGVLLSRVRESIAEQLAQRHSE